VRRVGEDKVNRVRVQAAEALDYIKAMDLAAGQADGGGSNDCLKRRFGHGKGFFQ